MTPLPVQHVEGMIETIEILSDQVFSQRLWKSLEQAKAGKTVSLAEAEARLEL